MNDHDAIDAIAEVIHSYGQNGVDAFAVITKIAYIIGYNHFQHQAEKDAEK